MGLLYTNLGITLWLGKEPSKLPEDIKRDLITGTNNGDYLAAATSRTLNNKNYHIVGNQGNDTLIGGAGSDLLEGGADNDSLNGGKGNDILIGGTGRDRLFGGEDDDWLFGGEKVEVTAEWGDVKNSTKNSKGSLLSGGTGDDTLVGSDQSDAIFSGEGSNKIYAGEGDDFVFLNYDASSAEDDWSVYLTHDAGDNRNLINIKDIGYEFSNTNKEDVNVVYAGAGNDFILASGTKGNNFIYGGYGNDSVYGGQGGDLLFGEAGDDYIVGDSFIRKGESITSFVQIAVAGESYGNDTIDGGDGNDTIIGGGGDDALYGGSGNDLIYGDHAKEDLAAEHYGDDYLDGGDGDDRLYGGGGNDTLVGGAGHDRMDGGTGDDLLMGGTGNDNIDGGEGNDYIDGGADNDTLWGSLGNDTLLGGDGNDSMVGDNGGASKGGGDDYMEGGAGDDSMWGNDGHDTLLGGEGNDYMMGENGDDYLEGGAGHDTLSGGDGNDTLLGGEGNDSMVGGNGNDYMDGGAGDDTLLGEDGNDTLLGGEGNDFLQATDGDNILSGGEGNDTLVSSNADGGIAGNNFLDGGSGNDTLVSQYSGNDTLHGGLGADQYEIFLNGNTVVLSEEGNDLDKVVMNQINFYDKSTKITQLGAGLKIESIHGTVILSGDYKQFEWLYFADTTISTKDLKIENIGESQEPVPGETTTPQTITGTNGNDTLQGGLGDDTYIYSGGIDTIIEAGGRDTLVFGNGIQFSQVGNYLNKNGNDLVLKVNGSSTDQVIIKDFFTDPKRIIETIRFETGGSISAQQIFDVFGLAMPEGDGGGTTPTDPIDPSPNPDFIATANDDLYIYTSGAKVINELGGSDTLVFSNGIQFSQVGNYLNKSGNDLILKVDGSSTNQVTIKNFFLGGKYLLETINFETGGSLSAQQIFGAFGLPMPKVEEKNFDQTITGTNSNDTNLVGTSGKDLIQGLAGNDQLFGLAGNDQLEGGAGNDRLDGGAGNDLLMGGIGDDTYLFNRGFGQDTIDNTGGGNDSIYFEGITFNEVGSNLTKSGNDLILKVSGTNDQVTIKDWFIGGENVVQNIAFASGGSISAGQIFGAFGLPNARVASSVNNLITAMATFGCDDGSVDMFQNSFMTEQGTPPLYAASLS